MTTIQVIEVPGWMLGMLNRNHWVRERNARLHELAVEAAELLLSMRLGCLCTTVDLEIVRCEKHRLADLLEKMCDA